MTDGSRGARIAAGGSAVASEPNTREAFEA